MTIEERIAEAEALNRQLRGIVSHPFPQRSQSPIMRRKNEALLQPVRNLCSYDWLSQVKPSFKAFCERTLVGVTPSLAEILNRKLKSGNAAIRSAMKPKGINTILKSGRYETGRWVKYPKDKDSDAFVETSKIIRVSDNEWSSEEPDPKVVVVPQNVPALGQGRAPWEKGTFPTDDDEATDETPIQEAVVRALEEQNQLLRAYLAKAA